VDAQSVVTLIVGTDVVVVAIRSGAADAVSFIAGIVDRTGVTVVTTSRRGFVLASTLGKTDVFRTGIAVVTLQTAVTKAFPLAAHVTGGAGVQIIARFLVIAVDAAHIRDA
jgi:hypothetical protein